jgi:hypothetical protein
VSSKEGTFFKERGHDSREKNSVNFWPKYFSAVGGRTVRIRTVPVQSVQSYGFGTEIEAFLARFSRQISDFLWLFLGRTEQSVQLTVGTENEVQKRPYNSTVLARKTRQISVGQIWCCEVFSLAGNVDLLLFCTFLKHNNKISLSLSWVSPHWGFPWHLPKFLSVIGLLSTVFFRCIFCLAMCISAYGNF